MKKYIPSIICFMICQILVFGMSPFLKWYLQKFQLIHESLILPATSIVVCIIASFMGCIYLFPEKKDHKN